MIIYKITNIINGKCYIGQTTQLFKRRIINHKTQANVGKSDYFHNSIRKHSIENFKWEVLCECESKEILNIMETFMIMVHKTHRSQGGYNLTWGGEGSNGFKHSEETKKKISEKKKGIKMKPFTEEHKRKIGEAQKGNKRPEQMGDLNPSKRPEVREKIRQKKIKNIYEFISPTNEIFICNSLCKFSNDIGLNRQILRNAIKGLKTHSGWKGRVIGEI